MQLKLKILIKKPLLHLVMSAWRHSKMSIVECVQKEFQTEAMQNPGGQQFLPCGCAGW